MKLALISKLDLILKFRVGPNFEIRVNFGIWEKVQLIDVGLCREVDRGKIKNLMGLTEEGEWVDEDESISGCNKWYKPEDSYGEYVGQKPIDCFVAI